MKNLIRKIFRRGNNSNSNARSAVMEDINDTTNAVFEKYKKSFKDLARYDREEKIGVN